MLLKPSIFIMYKLFGFSCFIFFIILSCKTFKQVANQEIINTPGSLSFSNTNDAMIVEVEINNKLQPFLFDTGAKNIIAIDSTIFDDFQEQKSTKSNFSIKGGDGERISKMPIVAQTKSNLFESNNKVFSFIDYPKSKCQQDWNFKGILGMSLFFKDDLALKMNFVDNEICNITTEDKLQSINEGFVKVKSECKSNAIFIYLIIEGIEYKLLVDTGFLGNIVLRKTDEIDLSHYSNITFEGNMYKTIASVTNGEECFYKDIPLKIGNISIPSEVQTSSTLKTQIAGKYFIQNFEWLIDFAKNEVYIKRNTNPLVNSIDKKQFTYLSVNKNGKLIICLKRQLATDHNLNDEIASINREKVTIENICEMQNLLNKTKDWSTLKIEVLR